MGNYIVYLLFKRLKIGVKTYSDDPLERRRNSYGRNVKRKIIGVPMRASGTDSGAARCVITISYRCGCVAAAEREAVDRVSPA